MDFHWSGRGDPHLPDLTEIDLVLLGGDITHFAGIDVARTLIEKIQEAGPRVLAVCGNCDRPEIEGYLEQIGIDLDRRAQVIAGTVFAGLSAGLPFGGCPYERTEKEFAAAAGKARAAAEEIWAPGPTILLSHQPPYGTKCDRVLKIRHVGSHAIRELIEDWQPDLVLCGHIHESAGDDLIGKTRVINPGPWRRGHSLRFDITTEGIEIREKT
jgi:Icc-related predicted phosphoesterase